ARATGRAGAPTRTSAVRRRRSVGPETASAISAEVPDQRRAATLTEQLGQAYAALDRERFDDARRLGTALLRQLPRVAAVHEVVGLAAYRTGRWRQALTELELAQTLEPSVELLPVLADVHRALGHWSDVERIWSDVRGASPTPEVMAEARVVAAGALADRGDLPGALRTMERARTGPTETKRVRDHHLRQWYVLGDLNDRAGDPIEATRWFEVVARHDPDFVDVAQRLRALGR
ncbi:MAG: tetratricopeptide repeat protein, partial [Ilumatobacteraceae bacterium]